ncbi:FecR domain-containing protein [Larkinella arboricola]
MDAQLLQKYLRNECTPDEARQVLLYLATPDGQRQLQHLLETDLADVAELHLDTPERQQAQRLFSRIQARKQTVSETPVRPLRSSWRWMAAVGLIVLATGSLFFYRQFATPQPISLHTDFGQTRRVVLPDQSIVTMNGNTTLRYFEHWKADQPREVWVEGEAFFEVVHTRNHQRFQVHLPTQMNVEVLGTRFNVYTRKTKTKVVLNEGRIQMRVANNSNNHLEMQPGEMFMADTETKAFYKKRVNAQAHSSWRTDKLSFEGTTLGEIAQLLKDTYGLDVEIPDQNLREQKVSGTVPARNANTILKGLSGLFDLKVTREANHILIE